MSAGGAPRIGVLALQGDVREHLAAFRRSGAEACTVRSAGELAGIEALALPGGESTAITRLLRAFDLEGPLRVRLAAGMRCFATCAGLILLSREVVDPGPDQLALGALDVAVRRNGYGGQVESFETDLAVPEIGPGPVRAAFIRAPVVERVAAGVTVLARHQGSPVVIEQHGHLAMSFHPELSGDDRIHRWFVERLRRSGSAAA